MSCAHSGCSDPKIRSQPVIIGLPRMHKETAELRDFLPDFVASLSHHDVDGIVIEEGYGSGMGFRIDNYLRASSKVEVGSYEDCLAQDVIIVLRAPAEATLRKIRRGAVVMAMWHYITNPRRNHLLLDLGLHAVSLDSVVDDRGRRLIENISLVGWNGMETAFRELQRTHAGFEDPTRPPLRVTILGSGAVAGASLFAACRYGDQDLHARMVARGMRGVEVTVVDYDVTSDEEYMSAQLSITDVLVDASRRPNPSKAIIPNAWLGFLPAHAVICDLSADPYDFSQEPPTTKAIEGIPHGTLEQYVFPVDDPSYKELAELVETSNRRIAVSCYSWPGIHPRDSMELYGSQLAPLVNVVLDKSPETWDIASDDHLERSLARAEVTRWHHMANLSR
jgi:alanine dehydrogenase